MFYFYATLTTTVAKAIEWANDDQSQGWVYVIHALQDVAEEGEFSLPLQTTDLRQTIVNATGYEYDNLQWAEYWEDRIVEYLNTTAVAA